MSERKMNDATVESIRETVLALATLDHLGGAVPKLREEIEALAVVLTMLNGIGTQTVAILGDISDGSQVALKHLNRVTK